MCLSGREELRLSKFKFIARVCSSIASAGHIQLAEVSGLISMCLIWSRGIAAFEV